MKKAALIKSLAVSFAACLSLLSTAPTSAAENEIAVTLLGTGTPILNVNRFGMSTLVEAGKQKLLFDAGRGAAIRLHQTSTPLRDIDAIFITHLHSDHLTGLPDIYASAPLPTDDGRRVKPLELYGPQGIDSVANGIQTLFVENNRIRETGKEVNPAATSINVHTLAAKGGVVYEKDGVVVRAFLVDHGHVHPAYGYRIDYAGRSVVLSGDTTYAPNLVENAKGADLLVHCVSVGSRELEAAHPEYVKHFYEYLANPEMVSRILNETHPGDAVLSHISLYSRGNIARATDQEIIERISRKYDGKFVVGQDLMRFVVSANGVARVPYQPSQRQLEPTN
ncbi:MBL fold metallo-hydrolase [Burkholderia sp. SRS-W-2-2016]|uniref:MBL fold metallo-hydrolase n=1 Tax=Burkholderia sp. SRS-W-2-2016 TaxID=1926878 RepID=UPI00094AD0D4|nr:MBL fold metallo-hydrolase [Burkholderia sp. SRS-W-2-2016]OLL29671.1 MBL fold metallo-hydrolase [Burkholderia sp. SRS-W-2-2016]